MADWRNMTLTIPSGGTRSVAMNLTDGKQQHPKDMWFFAPATLPESVRVFVAPAYVADPTDPSYVPLQSGAIDVALPTAVATPIGRMIAAGVVLVAGGAVAADRVFAVRGSRTSMAT